MSRRLASKESRDFGQTPGMILPDTSVELEVVVATRTYRIVRDARGIRVTDPKDWVASEQLDVRSLLNPRILSQRQIADIAGNREAQLLELDATIPESIRAFTIEAGTLVSEFERRQVELRRLRAQQALIPAVETEFRTVSDKISFLEQGESQDLLQRMAALQAEQRWLDVALRALVDRRSALDEESTAASAADASLSSPPQASPTAAWLREVELRVRQQLQESAELSRVRSNGLAATKEAIEAERQQIWEPAYREASEAFAALETEARERGVRFSEHRSLIARRLELETKLAPLRDAADRISSAAQRVEQAWRNLRDLHLRRAEERRRAADALRERVDDIRLDLAVFGDSSGLLRRREEWFGGTGLQERDWEQIVDYVYEAPDGIADRWHAVVTAMAEDVDATSALGRPL